MASVLLKSEPLPVEVGDQVFWVKLETHRLGPAGDSEATIQFRAFLPPGMRPAALRGADRERLVSEVSEAIKKQVAGGQAQAPDP